jgi:hypothetical protein
MRFHSIFAHANNTFALVDGLWVSRTAERYGWERSAMYPCAADAVPNGGPQDHSDCRRPGSPFPIRTYRVRGIDTELAETLDYANEGA